MMLRRAHALVLAGLGACQAGPISRGSEDAAANDSAPADGGGSDIPPAFSMFPEETTALPLTSAMVQEVLPPSWHIGERWEVMFCTAGSEWTRRGEYDTTRVLFKVVAIPEPGAYSAVVEVKQHKFPYAAWVGELSTINGVQVAHGSSRIILEESVPRRMSFVGGTFDSIVPLSYDRYQRPSVEYQSIGEHLGTAWIRDFTPHVPPGLRNPEITGPTETHFQTRRSITPTPDGLVYQAEEGTDSVVRRTVFWRRGESWWSYARTDAIILRDPMDAGDGEYRAPDGNTSFAWAIKLPPGAPDSLDCNSKH